MTVAADWHLFPRERRLFRQWQPVTSGSPRLIWYWTRLIEHNLHTSFVSPPRFLSVDLIVQKSISPFLTFNHSCIAVAFLMVAFLFCSRASLLGLLSATFARTSVSSGITSIAVERSALSSSLFHSILLLREELLHDFYGVLTSFSSAQLLCSCLSSESLLISWDYPLNPFASFHCFWWQSPIKLSPEPAKNSFFQDSCTPSPA